MMGKPMTVVSTLSCMFALFFCSVSQAAEAPIGKVVAIRGKVVALNVETGERPLSMKAPVFLHDIIRTQTGRIQMMFEDNTLITLGRDTEMKISEYAWKPESGQAAMETEVREGSFRIMGGAITRMAPEKFKTRSLSGTIGIRGSMYAGSVAGKEMKVLFHGGKGIYVQNDSGQVNISRPGFATRVESPDQPPATPAKMSPEDLLDLENSLASTGTDPQVDDEPAGASAETAGTDAAAEGETGAQTLAVDSDMEETDSASADFSDGTFSEAGTDSGTGFDSGLSDTFADVSSIVSDTVLTSTQTSLANTIQPSGTEQTILSLLLGLGFSGPQSVSVPSSGIWEYAGKMKNTLQDEPLNDMKLIVNWDNKRIIAFEAFTVGFSDQGIGFGFGDVTSSGGIANIKVLGTDAFPGSPVMALDGSETFGHFYGTGQEALGMALEGYDVNVQNQSQTQFWSDIIAATVNSKSANPYTGTETWYGFFVGVAEDMAAPNTNRRVFQNTGKTDFSLAINKDSGTVSGSMSGTDFLNGSNDINAMTIGGGTSQSVYLNDKIMAATLSGSNVISISPGTGGLKTHGNYMVTSRKPSLSSYTTWGYWEAAYQDPVSSNDYHIHVPGSMWIAGLPTGTTYISNLIATNFSGTYTGKAEGVMFDNSSQMTQMTNGTASLTIDFNSGASIPVSGLISFDQVNLPVTSTTGNVTTAGFQGTISTAASSNVAGTYYGPAAEAIGGKFSAQMAGGTQYHGIFAGNR